MNYIYANQNIDLSIDVFKGSSTNKEDFSRADLKVFFLIGNDRLREAHECSVNTYGTIKVQAVAKTTGVYSVRVVWVKDGHKFMYCEQSNVFGVTNYADEATNPTTSEAKIKLTMHTATYGYDGLDAYELSVLRGKTSLSEEEWLEKINSGGGSGETKVTYSEWELSFNLAKTVANPDGDLIKVESASVSRVKTTKVDGEIISQVPESRFASLNIVNGTQEYVDGVTYIKVLANESETTKHILVKAYDDDAKLSKTIDISQDPATSIYIINAKEADGHVMEFSSREVIIDDSPVTLYFKKYGEITSLVASGSPSWLTVSAFSIEGDGYKCTLTPTANTTEDERTAHLSVAINGTRTVAITVQQSFVMDENAVLSAELSYDDISSSGSEITPKTKSAKITTVYTRSSGREITVVNNNPTVTYSFSDSGRGLVNETTGKVTYLVANRLTERTPLVMVTMTVEAEGFDAIEKKVQVYQAGAKMYAYWGGGASLPTTGDTTNKAELGTSGVNIGDKPISGRYKWIAVPDGYTPKMVNKSPEVEIELTKQTTPVSFANVNCYIYYFDSRLATTVTYNLTVIK